MDFKDISGISFETLTADRINESADVIIRTYHNEGIWLKYTKAEVTEELMCAFSNLVYKPVFHIALHNGKIIGIGSYLWSHCSGNIFELSFGTIHPEYQRRGIGQYLTYIRIKEILELSDPEITMFVVVARRPELFKKFNFTTVCKMKNEQEEAEYMICKAKDLNLDIYR
jgi:N-acetylglutamate synthase-like GNAT family acetyltransferase